MEDLEIRNNRFLHWLSLEAVGLDEKYKTL